MLKVVGCFVGLHDARLVGLAASISALASFTTIQLLCHARHAGQRLRFVWLGVAAVAGGSGIWATHFIAMLAFDPGLPNGYDISLTLLSLCFAVVSSGCGLAVALCLGGRRAAWAGGSLVGAGIAVMHFTGMAAFHVVGHVIWDPWLVVTSIVIAVVIGSLALVVAIEARDLKHQSAAAALLILAICAHHFTAMGALTIVPDPTIDIASSTAPASWISVAVALASLAILLLAGAALVLDIRERRLRVEMMARDRMHSLANAAVEGLLVCRGDEIVSANDSFARLVEMDRMGLGGRSLSTFISMDVIASSRAGHPDHPVEAELRRANGATIPVEVFVHPINYAAEPHFAVAVRDLRARQRAEQQIQFLALHDGLTGLPNRTSFNVELDHRMAAANERGGRLAVICLDVDRFKDVNDLFGHAAGDTLLQDFAHIVIATLEDGQTMSRLGGDEFCILAAVDHVGSAGRLAERIFDALRLQPVSDGRPRIEASIGIALFPDDATDRTLLLNHSDTALYRAKTEGGATYRFYEEQMDAEIHQRRLLEHDLRHAIVRGEIHTVYQPQTRLETGELIGFEALLRWRHPERGSVPPSVFIPIAEECGLILQLGEWVLRSTCREAAGWWKPLSLAVNVSAVQLHSPDFVGVLRDALLESGLAPDRLEIEITETALIRDPVRALSTLLQIKTLGVRMSMDDFGTGYSSLSNLRQFPFDKIKIDRSFIKSVDTNDQAAAIVRSVLGLGRGLGLPVLAEGVETQEEYDFLRDEQCNEAQGYLIGRPGPIESFAGLAQTAAPPLQSMVA